MTTPHHKYTKLEVELIGALMRCEEISEEAEDLLIRIGVAGRREVFNPATLIVYWLFERDFNKLAEIKKGVEDGKD